MRNKHKLKDISNQRFGTLTAIKYIHGDNGVRGRWECLCDCGKTTLVIPSNLLRAKSCGCVFRREQSIRRKTHGLSNTGEGGKPPRLYNIWRTMKTRCSCPGTGGYEHYGGRGISVCIEWMEFEVFHKWALLNGYKDHLTIDRKDNDGDYTPSNCRWITTAEQNRNKRGVIRLENKGVIMCVAEWSRELGKGETWLMTRVKKGMSISEIIESMNN